MRCVGMGYARGVHLALKQLFFVLLLSHVLHQFHCVHSDYVNFMHHHREKLLRTHSPLLYKGMKRSLGYKAGRTTKC